MADIDKITVNNTTYNLKDGAARDSISQLSSQGAYDLNNLTTSGLFYCVTSSTNKPGSKGGGVLVIAYNTSSSNAVVQLFIENGTNTRDVYCRCKSSDTWQAWAQL